MGTVLIGQLTVIRCDACYTELELSSRQAPDGKAAVYIVPCPGCLAAAYATGENDEAFRLECQDDQ